MATDDVTHGVWIKIANEFSANPEANIVCPDCNTGFLKTRDELVFDNHTDRFIFCEYCNMNKAIMLMAPKRKQT